MCHVVRADQDLVAERPRLVAMFVKCIVAHLLHVDSAPTVSRFFTLRDCTDRMLTMELIGMPSHAFRVRSVVPRKENQKRLKNVLFFPQPQGGVTDASPYELDVPAHRRSGGVG